MDTTPDIELLTSDWTATAVGKPAVGTATSMLVAVDLMALSVPVARVAAAIACATRTSAHIVSVVSGDDTGASAGRSTWAGSAADARKRGLVQSLGAACPDATRWPVTIRSGDVVSVIAEMVTELGVDFLVAGLPEQHHASSLRDNVIKRLLRRVSVPFLGIAPNAYGQPHTVVAGIDFTPSSICAAKCAARVIAPGGTLYLAHVGPGFRGEESHRRAMRDSYADVTGGAFGRLQGTLDTPPGVRVERVALDGLPYEQLSAFAGTVQADLIAVGSHRLDGMASVGRLPASLLRDNARSVLIAPSVMNEVTRR